MPYAAKSLSALTLLFLAATSQVNAASFECSRAQQPDEKAICADRTLNDKDVKMALLYELNRKLQGGMGALGALKDAQVEWLSQRKACKADVKCLNASYDRRIGALRDVVDAEIANNGPLRTQK